MQKSTTENVFKSLKYRFHKEIRVKESNFGVNAFTENS